MTVHLRCRNGHPYTEANTYIHRGTRYCRACAAERDRAKREAQAAAPKLADLGLELSMSREDVAARLGVTPERVGQLERRALGKMRAAAKQRGLRLEDLL